MKIGVVIVTHYRLGQEFLQALRLIVPEAPEFYAVAIEPSQSVDEMRESIAGALRSADSGECVLEAVNGRAGREPVGVEHVGDRPDVACVD